MMMRFLLLSCSRRNHLFQGLHFVFADENQREKFTQQNVWAPSRPKESSQVVSIQKRKTLGFQQFAKINNNFKIFGRVSKKSRKNDPERVRSRSSPNLYRVNDTRSPNKSGAPDAFLFEMA
jgi:hypothetical protein